MVRPTTLLLAFLALGGCGDEVTSQIDTMMTGSAELSQKIEQLETRANKLSEDLAKAPTAPSAAGQNPQKPNMTPEQEAKEKEAFEVWKTMRTAFHDGKYQEARTIIARIRKDFADTEAPEHLQEFEESLAVIGSDAPKLTVEEWYTGETAFTEGKATIVVFWEVWCPHCKREVPELQVTYDKFKDAGLNVVGLTQLSNDTTEEQVKAFLAENKVSYPMAKINQDLPSFFKVQGVPAAAVVKDGKIVWRGHPDGLTEDRIQAWL
ncbi:MAG: thiol-disulfide isomerase/thioredoxin [Kiritimatiellia bacterium]|jgi:thiol-disulfide isomerase/thioredoxin